MADEEIVATLNVGVYLNAKSKAVLDKAQALGLTRGRFVGLVLSKHGEAVIAELNKQGFGALPKKQPKGSEAVVKPS